MNKLLLLLTLCIGGVTLSFTKTDQPQDADIQAQWEIDHVEMLDYMKSNDIEAEWLNSGLYYVINKEGGGDSATAESTVEIKYTISMLNGLPLWSTEGESEEHALPEVIRAWREGVPLIKEGGKIQMIIPSGLAYGPSGLTDKVPENANLLCTLELVKVVK